MSLPRMSLHIGDYKKDTGHLRAAGHGAYFLLIMHYWATGGLPDDDKQLAAIACMTGSEWRKIKPVLFQLFKGSWSKHKRVDHELAVATEKYEKRSAAGSKGGSAPRLLEQKGSNASAKPKQPITDNQEPEERAPSLRSGGARSKAACRLPEDWQPTLADLDFAQNLLSDDQARGEIDKFRDHWRAANGPPSIKRDWSAAWRNWCRKAVEINGYGQIQNRRSARNGTGKRTVHEAAADQLEQLRALNRPAPSDLCDGAGEIPLRRISSG